MKSLHSLTPILSFSNFQTVSVLYTSFPHLNVGTRKSKSNSRLHSTPTPANHCQWWTGIWNLRNPWLQDWQPMLCLASYCILSVGQGMRGTDKETSWILASELGHASKPLQISTLHIQPSLILCQVFDLGAFHFKFEVLFEVFTLYKSNQFYYYSTPL